MAQLSPNLRFRRLAFALIALATIARLLYVGWFCPFDLAPDEAHYWEWSRRLDWWYYSKGPLVAWLIRLSCDCFGAVSINFTGSETLAIRLPAIACGTLLLVGLHRLTLLAWRDDGLALAVVAIALTHPLIHAGSLLMTIDAPLLCAWMWALVFVWQALFAGSRTAWLFAGCCVAIGLLAKPTMVLWLPSLALLLATTPTLRHHLRERGFWLLVGAASLAVLPAILWNAQNDWVTIRHAQGHAGFQDGESEGISWLGPFKYFGAQVGVLLGVGFAAWIAAVWRHRPWRDENPETRFLWCMSVPTFCFFVPFTLKNNGGEPNWPIPAYLAGVVIVAGMLRDFAEAARSTTMLRLGLASVVGLGIVGNIAMLAPVPMQPILLRLTGPASERQPMPIRRLDPTARLRGWKALASEVDLQRAGLKNSAIAGGRWTIASELAYHCEGHPEVFSIGSVLGDRHSQYDLWRPNPISEPDLFQGRSFVLINVETERIVDAFERLEAIRTFEYREGEQLIAVWTIQIGHGFRGFRNQANAGY